MKKNNPKRTDNELYSRKRVRELEQVMGQQNVTIRKYREAQGMLFTAKSDLTSLIHSLEMDRYPSIKLALKWITKTIADAEMVAR